MTMPEGAPVAVKVSGQRVGLLKVVLIASLALNLLFIGGAAAKYFTHGRIERMTGISQMQLIPRRFFGEVDGTRRKELLAVLRSFRGEFRDGRELAHEQTTVLATALEASPYDEAKVKAAVDMFSSRSASLIGMGGNAALTFIAKLTPDERLLLAKHIRLRAAANRHGRKGGNDRR